jgi:hypothetical protein
MLKKILLCFLFLAAAGSIFAQFKFQGGLDTVFMPFQYVQHSNGVGIMGMGIGQYDSNMLSFRTHLGAQCNLEKAGFLLQLKFLGTQNTDATSDGANLGFGDNAFVWWRPFGFLRFDAGKFIQHDLSGKIEDHWTRNFTAGMYNGFEIFTPFRGRGWANAWDTERSDFGFLASFNYTGIGAYILIPGLWAGSGTYGEWFNPNEDNNTYPQKHNVIEVVSDPSKSSGGYNEIRRVLERVQFAVSYTLTDRALFRVQYVGANKTALNTSHSYSSANTPRIEAAVQLIFIPGLNLDLGGKYHLPWAANEVEIWYEKFGQWDNVINRKETGKVQKSSQLSLGASYTGISSLELSGRLDTRFGGFYDAEKKNSTVEEMPFVLNFRFWPSYNFGPLLAGLDFGLTYQTETGKAVNQLGGLRWGTGAWGEYRWNQSKVRFGILYRAAGEFGGIKEDMVISVPVVFEYTF